MRRIPLLLLIMTFGLLHTAYCADISVSSTVSPEKAYENQQITLTIQVTGPDAAQSGSPILARDPNFTYRSGGTTSFNSITNGQRTASKSYTFILSPTKTGTFTVGEATIKVGNQSFIAPGKRIQVIAGAAPQAQTAPRSRNLPQRGTASDSSDNTYIKSEIDNKSPYVGEQITHTFELYNRTTIFGDPQYEPPSTTGFWKVALPEVPTIQEIISNQVYNHHTIKTALFPTTDGELEIGQASLTFTAGGFFSFGRSQTMTAKPITVKVKPLPIAGKPASFSGSVGEFTIMAAADKATLKTGDVVSVQVSIVGKGNFDLITSLEAPDLSAFKTYDPKVSNTISNSGFVVGGAKTWEYVIIPRNPGDITIEPFSFAFFNPKDQKYHTVATDPIQLKVTPGEPVAGGIANVGTSRTSVENIATDIHYIKPDKTEITNVTKKVYASIYFYMTYFVSLMIFAAAFTFKKRRDTIEENTGLRRRLKAWKKAQKRLDEASKLLSSGMTEGFCGTINDAITGYIADMLNSETGTMTNTSLEDLLLSQGIDSSAAARIRKTLELCDFVRFSSAGSGQDVQKNLYNEAREIITELKEEL